MKIYYKTNVEKELRKGEMIEIELTEEQFGKAIILLLRDDKSSVRVEHLGDNKMTQITFSNTGGYYFELTLVD